tara:strand:- start:3373 stop:5481 length:2109 start_codon:yes stop_codon:yes gene_type:complete
LTVSAGSSGWNFGGIDKPKITVFDDTFFHDNIFAAREFTRETKQNLSSFIIGTQGVQSAQKIAERKKLKGDKTRERNQLQRDGFSDIQNLKDFLNLQVSESREQLENKIEIQRHQYAALTKRKGNIARIKERSLCTRVVPPGSLKSHVAKVNESLRSSLETHHEQASRLVSEHIASTFVEKEGAEAWIQRGLQQSKGKSCQFCGQMLQEDAKRLLELYRLYFDITYKDHERSVRQMLNGQLNNVKEYLVAPSKLKIQENLSACLSYSELLEDESYLSSKNLLEELSRELTEAVDAWEQERNKVAAAIEEKTGVKLKSPHQPQPELSGTFAEPENGRLQDLAVRYNHLVGQIVFQQQGFKDSSEPTKIDEELRSIIFLGQNTRLQLQRLEKDALVSRMKTLDGEIQTLTAEIPLLEASLQTQQSNYLEGYFSSLNKWFHEFGSKDFALEMALDSNGHTPVYFLKVLFRGKHVSEKNLAKIFSESDRRALALAVFWAHIDNMNAFERQSLLVVLDDPVTSFDNGRISSVHNQIISLHHAVRQVIVLSHYEADIAKFLLVYGRNHPVNLLAIENSGGASTLCRKDPDDFVHSDHELKRRQISAFIDGLQNSHAAGDLRIFLETELTFRFSRSLQAIGAFECMLGEKIDRLQAGRFISETLAEQAHSWRERLNPAHHCWTSDDAEDQRRTAAQFMDFVYKDFSPAV